MYIFIIKNILPKWNNKSTSFFIHVLTLLLTILSLSFIMIALSINDAFKDEIINKIIQVDGVGRYTKINNGIDKYDNDEIVQYIENVYPYYVVSKVEVFDAILKHENKSEGVLFHSYDDNGVDVFNLEKYIVSANINVDGIIVGKGLSKKNDLNINDTITIINFYSLKGKTEINIENLKVSAIFQTDIPYYDNHVIYGHENLINTFNKKFFLSQIVVNNNSNEPNINISTLHEHDFNNYYFDNWEDRHQHFINWLYTYDGPIKILLSFIFIISILSIFSFVFIDLNMRKNDSMIFYILGIDLKKIKILYLLKNILISLIVGLSSICIAIIFIYIQNSFNLISLPSNIYILDSLPVSLNYQHFMVSLPFVLITSFIASLISLKSYIQNDNYIELDELL